MGSTSVSFLDRLRDATPSSKEWSRLQEIYLPLIRYWLMRVPEVGDEANDLAQDVMVVLFRELRSFQRQRDGSFRAWLRQITLNRIRAFQKRRRQQPLAGGAEQFDHLLGQLEDSNSDLAREWDVDHDKHVLKKLLNIVQPDFEAKTWEAFRRFGIEDRSAATVAADLGLSESAVIQAKFRVMKRLREEAGELID